MVFCQHVLYIPNACSVCGAQNMASDPLELEIVADGVSPLWVLGNELNSSARATSALDC